MAFPTDIPPAGTAITTQTLSEAGHTALHNDDRDNIRAIAQKVGTGASTPTASTWMKGTGVGTSSWSSIAKGDVGLGNVDNTSDATKNTATATLTNKTLTSPTIGNFSNATHDHTNAAGGGTLGTNAIDDDAITAAKWTNPYNFLAYLTADQTGVADNVFTKVALNGEAFDTNSDFDSTTNNRYDVPINGIYQFSAYMFSPETSIRSYVRAVVNGTDDYDMGSGRMQAAGTNISASGHIMLSLSSGDYVELWCATNLASGTGSFAGGTWGTDTPITYLSGALIHAT